MKHIGTNQLFGITWIDHQVLCSGNVLVWFYVEENDTIQTMILSNIELKML